MKILRYTAAGLLVLTLWALLVACGSKSPSFDGTVLSVTDDVLLTQPDEDTWESRSSDKILVSSRDAKLLDSDGGDITLSDIPEGARVRVFYSGTLLELYPSQAVDCREIRLLD